MKWRREACGLTLTEVLLAVMILAVLGTAAVSETIESKTRADVARVRADLRKVAMALEAYRCDQGAYPHLQSIDYNKWRQRNRGEISLTTNLTTPVAYLDNVKIRDPFTPIGLTYMNVDLYYYDLRRPKTPSQRPAWYLISLGPDRLYGPHPLIGNQWNLSDYLIRQDPDQTCRFIPWRYDPSNGTISKGDILRYQE